MKKNNFIQGAFIVTLGIILSKVLGILYVIPFHQIIGEQGGALYGYAYTFYGLFLSISMVGIPLAVSKIISEYDTLGYYDAKKRAYKISLKIVMATSVIAFLVLFLFAPIFANYIMGDITGGNSIQDITFALRVSSVSLLIVTVLAVVRGYLQGHKFMTDSSISQVIEQFFRIAVLLIGSYLTLNVFKLGLTNAVGVAVFGAFVGAAVALIYLIYRMKKTKELKPIKYEISDEEKKITNRVITKRLLMYCLPFLMIGFITSTYEMVDMMTVVKTLVNTAGFTAYDAESVMAIMTTWGSKLNVVVTSIASGVTTSLIPNIASSFVKSDMKDVERKINKSFELIMYVTIPAAVGLSLLANPVWNVFYGPAKYGANVFWFTILTTIFSSLFMNATIIMQSLNRYKVVLVSLLSGFIWNALMNIPMMKLCHMIGLPTYFGATIASMIGYIISLAICIYILKKDYSINFKNTNKNTLHIISANIIMIIVIKLFSIIIPINVSGTLNSALVILFYTLIGAITYFIVTYKDKTFDRIFGNKMLQTIANKIPLLKKIIK